MNIVEIISNLGVPVACLVGCAWFIKYLFDKTREDNNKNSELHKQEMDKITEALNNNTLALTKLCEKLGLNDEVGNNEHTVD